MPTLDPAFLDTRMDDRVSYNFEMVAGFQTGITTLETGHEFRNSNWDDAKLQYSGQYANFEDDEFEDLLAHFRAVLGPGYGFRFKDWFDFRIINGSLGVAPAGSTAVQLYKYYQFGSRTISRLIAKPVAGTLILKQAGVNKTVTMDPNTGLMIPTTAWTPGAALVVEYLEFDTPVRFMNDELHAVYNEYNAITTNAELIEVNPFLT